MNFKVIAGRMSKIKNQPKMRFQIPYKITSKRIEGRIGSRNNEDYAPSLQSLLKDFLAKGIYQKGSISLSSEHRMLFAVLSEQSEQTIRAFVGNNINNGDFDKIVKLIKIAKDRETLMRR